jgi:hypothetical protein
MSVNNGSQRRTIDSENGAAELTVEAEVAAAAEDAAKQYNTSTMNPIEQWCDFGGRWATFQLNTCATMVQEIHWYAPNRAGIPS